ncbi:MAG: GTPase [Verrucomicrobiales bacterium]
MRVTLSLISHTNVGKTTLARTLLRRDVGDALDQPHVTDVNEAHTMVESRDHELVLWDTPGFGDSARLLARLKLSDNPVVWFLSQMWDRFADRPLWCGQQAVKNVRDEADVVLYLINAAEDPAAAGYVGMEMQILGWIGKPVAVLLNQTGQPAPAERLKADAERWREHLKAWDCVKDVVSLDAYSRCWVQEDLLLARLGKLLPADRTKAFATLADAWRRKNAAAFDASVAAIAAELAASASDAAEVPEQTFLEKLGLDRRRVKAEMEAARRELGERLARRVEESTDALIAANGLEGKAARGAADLSQGSFGVPEKVNEPAWTAIGGLAGGASTGLVADILHGGMTFGGGAIVGGLAGAASAYIIAKGFNLAKGQGNTVRWSQAHFRKQFQLALLRYLAIAHYGRGRDPWEEGTIPEFWQRLAESATELQRRQLEQAWKKAGTEKRAGIEADLAKAFHRAAEQILKRIYPEWDGA